MVTLEKLLQCANTKKYQIKDVPENVINNLKKLVILLNNIEKEYKQELVFTCSYRDEIHNKKVGGAKNSNHLYGFAVDIADSKNNLYNWLVDNNEAMANKYDIFIENIIKKDGTKRNWVHISIAKFASYKEGGTRVFNP